MDFSKTSKNGFYADRIYEESLSLNGVNEVAIKTQNCIVYLLENTKSSSTINVYASVSKESSTQFGLSNSIQTINVISDNGVVQCYVEIYIPGGITLPKISITYDGDSSEYIQLYDYKSGTSWVKPMIISSLILSISNSYPSVYFKNAHTVSSLLVSGSFWVCNFNTLKIISMTFTVSVGSLNINQNKEISQNSITMKTPHGTHWIAGATINTVDSGWPSSSKRDSGFTGTYVDTTSYCVSTLFVCSNTAVSWPASGAAVLSGQGSFKITLDDGPVQFLIDRSTTTASLTYTPTYDQFAITSQILLNDNKNDFGSYSSDPRIYMYPIVSPGYERMWVHSSLKQYIQARPWLLSVLSLGVLKPTYYRKTLIHIPGTFCPYLIPNDIKQNTLISMKLK